MKRGPKPGKAGAKRAANAKGESLGKCPSELVGPGRQLWMDAARHLRQMGQSARVHRTGLLICCRLVESLDADAGINKLDAVRRWLHEMGLTVLTAVTPAVLPDDVEQPQDGRSRVLSLIARKAARE